MKINIAQQNYTIGDLQGNTSKIIQAIQTAESDGADLVIFSEMSVCGHPSEDLLLSREYIHRIAQHIEQIATATQRVGVILGAPEVDPADEKALYNSAWLLHEGKVCHTVRKSCLTHDGLLNESRYFQAGSPAGLLSFQNKKIALFIGDEILHEAAWQKKAGAEKADMAINITATAFDYISSAGKSLALKQIAKRHSVPLICCNTAGAQTGIIFEGSSTATDAEGNVCLELKQFEEDNGFTNLLTGGTFSTHVIRPGISVPLHNQTPERFVHDLGISEIRKALVTGIREYFSKTGLKKAILGNSGGIDSAVTLALACEALGGENVFSLLMPSQYSSDHSITDAEQLSKNLKSGFEIVPIKDVFTSFQQALKPVFKGLPEDVTEENIQARTRGNLLMAVANKFNYVLLNTSNKSELAVGYGTLYGDLAGGLSVLGDCYKKQVYALAENINSEKEIIPNHIIHKIPSAELRPNQFDSQSLPDYDILDPVLYQYIEKGKQGSEIKDMGYDEGIVDFVIRLVNKNEFKRHQFCPILRISPRAFGSDRRIPVVARYS